MESQKKKKKQQKQPVNRPFVLNAVGGPTRYGITGGVTQLPLAIKAVGNDGLPPHDKGGNPVSVRVRFQTVKVPEGAEENLVSGTLKEVTVQSDDDGRATVGAQLGTVVGAYTFAAALPDFDDGVDVDFVALTEGAVAAIQVAPVKPASVDQAMRVNVTALDWQDKPVTDARLEATLLYGSEQENPGFFKAKHIRGGQYTFMVRSQMAGALPLEIVDVATDTRVQVLVTFLPGKVRRLEIRQPEDPRERPPFNQTRLDAVASDRFGNLVPDVKVKWQAPSGRFEAVAHGPEVSDTAIFRFGDRPAVTVTASAGSRKARMPLRLAGTYVRLAEVKDFIFTGDPFKVWVEVFPPAGGGVARGFIARLREPVEVARRTSFSLPNPDNGVPEPELVEGEAGRLDISVYDMNVPVPYSGGSLLVAELYYDCLAEQLACFETLEGVITIARSPDEELPLPPGFKKCPDQKRKEAQRLCLNICIAVKPGGGKTFDDLKTEVQQQLKRTQDILDENIEACCPKIEIKTCINELPWADYRKIVDEGEVRGALERVIYGEIERDKTKDSFTVSPELKELLKKCRKAKCVSIYYVPDHRYKSGATWHQSDGFAASPNGYPETTGAAGSGPGLVLSQGLNVNAHTLAHELGHLLIDLPRDQNNGDEHVDNSNTDRVMKQFTPHGRKFTRDECGRIFSNVGKYGGDC